MLLSEDIIKILKGKDCFVSDVDLANDLELNQNTLVPRIGWEEMKKKKFELFQLYLQSMVENGEIRQNEGGYSI
ncbi:MAG: hypothetical protein KKF67_01510 [Nanoarchaeota archaeon]|nr:hypothetical protein [Nanoarchaeota archaeon]